MDLLDLLKTSEKVNLKLKKFDIVDEEVYIKIRLRKLVADEVNIDTIIRTEGSQIAIHDGTNEKHVTILCLAPDTNDRLVDLDKHPIDGVFRGRRIL